MQFALFKLLNYKFIIIALSALLALGAIFIQKLTISRLKADNSTLQLEIDNLASAYASLLQNSKKLEALRQLDGQVIIGLETLLKENTVTNDENVKKQVKLEQSKPSVKSYLDASTPVELKRLLDEEDAVH